MKKYGGMNPSVKIHSKRAQAKSLQKDISKRLTKGEIDILKEMALLLNESLENTIKYDIISQKYDLTIKQISDIYKICDTEEECEIMFQSKHESIRQSKILMEKEFCRAKRDTNCSDINSPEFSRFLSFFRPPPCEGDYPPHEYENYKKIWNDCYCDPTKTISEESVWKKNE